MLRDEFTHHRFSHEQEHLPQSTLKSPQAAEDPIISNFELKIKNGEGLYCDDLLLIKSTSFNNFIFLYTDTTEKIHCRRLATTRAHQQSITVLECDWGRILSGSQDHTLKVIFFNILYF